MIDKAYGDADELKTTQLKNGEILEVTGTVEAKVYTEKVIISNKA